MPKSKKKSLLCWYPEPEPIESVWGLTSTDMPSREHTSTDKPSRNAEALSQAAKALFNNAKLSDVTINIHTQQGATKLSAHSFVLAAISPYFRRALEGQYAESESKEFTFDQDSPHAYWRVFEYMYTGDYSDDPAKMEAFEDEPDDEELARDVRVYCLAEYFDVDSLKTDASERFAFKIRKLWVSDRFPDCIRDIYQSTTKSRGASLRTAVILEVKNNLAALWERQAFRELYREGGDFAEDLMEKKLNS
ncbi:hypothetical protein MY4038_006578 [Beauveria bassiana]